MIEDTKYTIDDLSHMGFSQEVIKALTLLTHYKFVPYIDYISKIKRKATADISLDKSDIQVYTVNINILFMKKQLTMYICPFNHNNNQDSIYDIMWK